MQLGVPYVELDAIYHRPGWEQTPIDELRSTVDEITRGDEWVLDGSYVEMIGDIVLARADTVVWLDLPLPLVLTRLTRRALRDIRTKRDLYHGNRQTWRWAFFHREALVPYAAMAHRKRRREWPGRFAAYPQLELVRLRSPADVEQWLERLG